MAHHCIMCHSVRGLSHIGYLRAKECRCCIFCAVPGHRRTVQSLSAHNVSRKLFWKLQFAKDCCRSWSANAFSPTSKRGVGTAFIVSISNVVSMSVLLLFCTEHWFTIFFLGLAPLHKFISIRKTVLSKDMPSPLGTFKSIN